MAAIEREQPGGQVPRVISYAFVTPTDLGGEINYRKACAAATLEPIPGGYGLLMSVSADGERYTLMTTDVEYVRMVAAASGSPEILGDLALPPDKFLRRDGWPDDWV